MVHGAWLLISNRLVAVWLLLLLLPPAADLKEDAGERGSFLAQRIFNRGAQIIERTRCHGRQIGLVWQRINCLESILVKPFFWLILHSL